MKIYLAGKITEHGWRESIVQDPTFVNWFNEQQSFGEQPLTLGKGRFAHHSCTGPFFLRYNHGSYHGDNAHGVGANGERFDRSDRSIVVAYCLDGIRRADVVFAWLGEDAFEAHGTIFELGYAKAIGTPVWIAGTEPEESQWFTHTAADRTLWNADSPADALAWFLDNSPFLPQSCDVYLKQAAADPEVIKARKIFTEFGPPGVRVPIPKHIRAAVWAKTGGTCWYCKQPTNPYEDFQVDHIFPVSKGGANRIDNLVPCCQACNAAKRDRIVAP